MYLISPRQFDDKIPRCVQNCERGASAMRYEFGMQLPLQGLLSQSTLDGVFFRRSSSVRSYWTGETSCEILACSSVLLSDTDR